MCLDDASPSTGAQRAYHYHFGNGSNRWNDKSVQFAVCSNGISGFIGDHSMLDASTVHGLNVFVTRAIMEHKPQETVERSVGDVVLEEYPFLSTPEIDEHIMRARQQFQENVLGIEHRFFNYTGFGASQAQMYKCPPKSVFQLVVVLASRHHFGYNPALWETVSLGTFHRGRVEISQVITPPIVAFCEAANDEAMPIEQRRKLFVEAVKTHASSVMRAVRGRGTDRHLTALRQMLADGEKVPALYEDPLFIRTRPRKIMSHCHDTGTLEKGFLLRDADAIWVHYELDETR